jgi:hypothetical protein
LPIKWLKTDFSIYRTRLLEMADAHINQSIDFVVGSDYAGSHWLASFLVRTMLLLFHDL